MRIFVVFAFVLVLLAAAFAEPVGETVKGDVLTPVVKGGLREKRFDWNPLHWFSKSGGGDSAPAPAPAAAPA